jgi:hypothetical protein
VNRDEAKKILLLYRAEADADGPQIAEALALAKMDAELSRWFEEHRAAQNALREKFQQILPPAGLKEQIISEQAARNKIIFRPMNFALATAAMIVALAILAAFWFRSPVNDNTFSIYKNRMAGVALRGYVMDLTTNNPAGIRDYLAQNHAPADYVLPAALEKTAMTGCAIESWQDKKVSMICFNTGKSGAQSDVWLFVVDRNSVKGAPPAASPQFAKVNQLVTASWTQDGKLYFLGMKGDQQTLQKFL